MAQYDDRKFLELGRPEQREQTVTVGLCRRTNQNGWNGGEP